MKYGNIYGNGNNMEINYGNGNNMEMNYGNNMEMEIIWK